MVTKRHQIDEELLYTGLDYFREGIKSTLRHNNFGYLTAFSNKYYNGNGFDILKEPFLEILEEFNCKPNIPHFPNVFTLCIKYSPIAQFKRWIFVISNKKFIAVTEPDKEFSREFYFLSLEDNLFFQPVLTNIAHEKFLLQLYKRKKIPETTSVFNTHFDKSQKLIVYKDYLKKKISTVKIPGYLLPKRLYSIKISYIKSTMGIKFRISVNNGSKINHAVKLSSIGMGEKIQSKNSDSAKKIKKSKTVKKISTKPFKSLEEYRQEVLDILKKYQKTEKATNKFANVSLGRINKIPILINMPAKYKKETIIIDFKKKKEVVITDTKGNVLKTFFVAEVPRSNWLEKH